MNKVEDILLLLQKRLQIRATDLDEEIRAYDRRRTGFLSITQFEQLLASLGLRLTPQEHRLVQDSFSAANGLIDHSKFVSAVSTVRSATPKRKDCSSALLALHQRLTEEHCVLKDLLRPYDKMNHGLVQENDFLKAVKPFPASIEVAKTFSDNGVIDINEIDNFLTELLNKPPEPPKSRPFSVFRAAHQLNHRQVDYWSIFSSRDRLRIGRLDIPLFSTLLTSTGIQITQEELKEIVNFYRFEEKVNYVDFLEDVKKAGIDEKEVAEKSKPTEEEPDFDSVIEIIKSICKKRKTTLSRIFEGYPVNEMTKYQFTHILNNSGLQLTPKEIDSLATFCEVRSGTVDASLLIKKIDIPRMESTALSDADKTCEKIKDFLQAKEIILTPRFEKFDREKSGEFPVSLVNSVLQQFGFHLTEYELESLQIRYPGHANPFIKWREFDSQIECPSVVMKTAANQQQLQQQKLQQQQQQIQQPTQSQRLFSDVSTTQETTLKPIPNHIITILKEIEDYASRSSLNLYDEFRFLDKNKSGFLAPYQVNSIIRKYFPKMSRTSLDFVMQFYGQKQFHYLEFCRDLQNLDNLGPGLTTSQALKENPELEALIKRLKAFTVKTILPPIDIFRLNDPKGIGFVPLNRTQNCFNEVHFYLTPQQMSLLVDQYCDKEFPERFNYLPLVNKLNMMKMDGEEVKWTLTPELAQNQINENAHLINCQIHDKLNVRRRRIDSYFEDAQNGPMSEKEFEARLNRLDIVLEPVEMQVLIKKYRSGNGIDWVKFVGDVRGAHLI